MAGILREINQALSRIATIACKCAHPGLWTQEITFNSRRATSQRIGEPQACRRGDRPAETQIHIAEGAFRWIADATHRHHDRLIHDLYGAGSPYHSEAITAVAVGVIDQTKAHLFIGF